MINSTDGRSAHGSEEEALCALTSDDWRLEDPIKTIQSLWRDRGDDVRKCRLAGPGERGGIVTW